MPFTDHVFAFGIVSAETGRDFILSAQHSFSLKAEKKMKRETNGKEQVAVFPESQAYASLTSVSFSLPWKPGVLSNCSLFRFWGMGGTFESHTLLELVI